MPYTDLDNYTIGNSIIINPHTEVNFNPCALSKYVVISGVSSRNSIIYNGDNINPSDSIYTEILACVLSSINKISPKKENKILVLGCGLLGILHLKILKMLGFKNVFCSYNKIERTKIIQDMGFKAISLDEIMERKYDVIFECVGKEELVSLAIRVSNDKCLMLPLKLRVCIV